MISHPPPSKVSAYVRSAVLMLAVSCSACLRGPQPELKVSEEQWRMEGFEHSMDLSGIASADLKQAVVVSDEAASLQVARFDHDDRIIRAGALVPLPVSGPQSKKKLEADLEAVAWSGDHSCFFAIGSHGLGKKKGDLQEARRSVFRIPYDRKTGEIHPSGIQRASLVPVIESFPELQPHLGKPLQKNGVNIEGLAAADSCLWVGLRAPNRAGLGYVIQVQPGTIFEVEKSRARLHSIDLGEGRGIREIAAVQGGFILLTGNASAEASKHFPETDAPGPDDDFRLHHWKPSMGRTSHTIGRLPRSAGKAEGILVLDEDPAMLKLLVLFDGLADGGCMTLELRKTWK